MLFSILDFIDISPHLCTEQQNKHQHRMNRTHLLSLLLLLSAACTQQEQKQDKEEDRPEETAVTPIMLTSIVTTDLDTAMVEPIDSVEDEEELPREMIIAEEGGTYHFTLVPDKMQDGKARYMIRRFRNVSDVAYEKGKEGLDVMLPQENGKPLHFRIPRTVLE